MIKILAMMLCILVTAPLALAGDKLHVIMVADTFDRSIGDGITANVARMHGFLDLVKAANIDVHEVDVLGMDFSCHGILEAASALDVKNTDAVLFYYSGHGFRRTSTQTKFPEFYCMRSFNDQPLELPQVVKALRLKGPRLLIAVADACNKGLPPSAGIESIPLPFPKDSKNALRHLFLDYEGTIVLSGAIPGEFSWYLNSGDDAGGYFTRQMLGSISAAITTDPRRPRWDSIILKSIQQMQIPTSPPATQDPQEASDFKEH